MNCAQNCTETCLCTVSVLVFRARPCLGDDVPVGAAAQHCETVGGGEIEHVSAPSSSGSCFLVCWGQVWHKSQSVQNSRLGRVLVLHVWCRWVGTAEGRTCPESASHYCPPFLFSRFASDSRVDEGVAVGETVQHGQGQDLDGDADVDPARPDLHEAERPPQTASHVRRRARGGRRRDAVAKRRAAGRQGRGEDPRHR